jgi:hyperosmotically inducible protein
MNHRTFLSAACVLFALGCAATPTQESTGEYTDDASINSRVKSAILNEPGLKQIDVETYTRNEQLSGFVATRGEMDRAVDLAHDVEGVLKVKNDMRLKQ